MKRIIVLMLICLVSAHAGILDSSKVVLPRAGSQSLEFGLSGLLSVGSYMGSTIALKKFSNPLKATRYVLNIQSDGFEYSGLRYEFGYDPTPTDSTIDSTIFDYKTTATRQDYFLSIQWLKYRQPYGHLSLLYGVGPLIGLEHSTRENASDPKSRTTGNLTSTTTLDKDVSTGVYFGLTPVVGVEWFLHRNVSFHAEYYSMIKIGWRQFTDDYAREYYTGDWHENNADLSGVYYSVRGYARGGVSFYFK